MNEFLDKTYTLWDSLSEDDKNVELDKFGPLYSYNTGHIENDAINIHDTREIFDKGRVVNFTGDVRTLFEIQNLKDSWNYMRRITLSDPIVFSKEFILDLHQRLTRGTYDESRWEKGERPGDFKHHDYAVADDVGYLPKEVPQAIGEFVNEINEALSENQAPNNIFVISCYAHAKLVDIHPFADGNGRCARALQNIILLNNGFPPNIVPEEHRLAYFGALDAFHNEDSLKPFIEFCSLELSSCWLPKLERYQNEFSFAELCQNNEELSDSIPCPNEAKIHKDIAKS